MLLYGLYRVLATYTALLGRTSIHSGLRPAIYIGETPEFCVYSVSGHGLFMQTIHSVQYQTNLSLMRDFNTETALVHSSLLQSTPAAQYGGVERRS